MDRSCWLKEENETADIKMWWKRKESQIENCAKMKSNKPTEQKSHLSFEYVDTLEKKGFWNQVNEITDSIPG